MINNKPVLLIKDFETDALRFDSSIECAEYLGCHVSAISKALRDERKTVKGYMLDYAFE